MARLLGVALLTVIMAGCSSMPLDPSSEQGATETEAGSVNLPRRVRSRLLGRDADAHD